MAAAGLPPLRAGAAVPTRSGDWWGQPGWAAVTPAGWDGSRRAQAAGVLRPRFLETGLKNQRQQCSPARDALAHRGTKAVGLPCPAGTSPSPSRPGPGQLMEPFRGGKLWQAVLRMTWWPAATHAATGPCGSSGARAASCGPGCWSSVRSKSMAQLDPAASWGRNPKCLLLLGDAWEPVELSLPWAELMSCLLVRNKFS